MATPSRLFSILRGRGHNSWTNLTEINNRFSSSKFSTPLICLLIAISYYGGVRIGIALTPHQQATSTFWPPNAILLAAFLLTPRKIWWLIVAAVLPAHLLAESQAGLPFVTVLGWFVGNAGEALLGAFCITHFVKHGPLFESVQSVVAFLVFGAFGAPFITSFLDAAVVAGTLNKTYWLSWTLRLFSNILAELILVPMIVIVFSNEFSILRRITLARALEFVALLTAIVVVSFLIFGNVYTTHVPALIYAPIPLLLLTTVRFGLAGLSASMLTLTCILIKNAFDGRGLLSGSFHESVLSWQILLCIIAVPLILLAALLTERRRTEESLRNTSGKLIYAQEQERQRIARDLHDDISQQLALLQVGIIEVRNEADSTLIPRLNALEDRLSEISTAVHELSHGLHPSQVIHLGLAAAIKNLIRDTNKKEFLDIEMVEQNVPDNVPPQIGLALFRVTQEALHNIAKHSQAVTGIVELRYSGRDLLLRISDDGVGFYPMQVSGAGLGLESMRERIRSLNGAFVITSAPMHGVTIEAWVPLERKRLQNSGAA